MKALEVASRRIGMLVPSSNTVVETVLPPMVEGAEDVSFHATRLRVTEVALDEKSESQFQIKTMVDAADLLADAKVHVLGWNGTAGSWLGFDRDVLLCRRMTETYGVPSTTAVLAINELLEELGARRFALISPYISSVQQDIIRQYGHFGFDCSLERHAGVQDNYTFGTIPVGEVEKMIRSVAAEKPAAIVVMCTNMNGAPLAEDLEREFDIPIIDSLAAFVWKSLRLAGVDTRTITGWGRLFQCLGKTSEGLGNAV